MSGGGFAMTGSRLCDDRLGRGAKISGGFRSAKARSFAERKPTLLGTYLRPDPWYLVFEHGGIAVKSYVPTSHTGQTDRKQKTKLDTAKPL